MRWKTNFFTVRRVYYNVRTHNSYRNTFQLYHLFFFFFLTDRCIYRKCAKDKVLHRTGILESTSYCRVTTFFFFFLTAHYIKWTNARFALRKSKNRFTITIDFPRTGTWSRSKNNRLNNNYNKYSHACIVLLACRIITSDHVRGSIIREVSRKLRNWKTWILYHFP